MDMASHGKFGRQLQELTADALPEVVQGAVSESRGSAQWASPTQAADAVGVMPFVGEPGVIEGGRFAAWRRRLSIRSRINGSDGAFMVIDPRPGLHIIEANKLYRAITLTRRREMIGRKLFEVFPDNPDDPDATGTSNLYTSLCEAARTGRTHGMATQRYDVVDASGAFVERYWSPTNTPFYDEEGRLLYLLHHARDVTDEVLAARVSRR